MRLGKLRAKNFSSFGELEFNYAHLGLTLISGHTRAGKSTLLDAPSWALFGQTSKESAADDVRSWTAEGAPTEVSVEVELPDGNITATRIRGTPKQNDLYWTEADDVKIRGKDITDTQKQLTKRIGVSAELYFEASYLSQFSRADQFFVAKAKERRETLEKIADLSMPILLAERSSEARKGAKRQLEEQTTAIAKLQGRVEQLRDSVEADLTAAEAWDAKHAAQLQKLQESLDSFEESKRTRIATLVSQVEALAKATTPIAVIDATEAQLKQQARLVDAAEIESMQAQQELKGAEAEIRRLNAEHARLESVGEVCPTCLGPGSNPHLHTRIQELSTQFAALSRSSLTAETTIARLKPALATKNNIVLGLEKVRQQRADTQRLTDKSEALRTQIEVVKNERNTWAEQLTHAQGETNPFIARAEDNAEQFQKLSDELDDAEADGLATQARITQLTWLYDKSFELRGHLLQQAVADINTRTNEILERFFDADIRAEFDLTDSDKLEVSITNEGYDCPFRQLSGGERCMLKLAFSGAYMAAAENRAGIHFAMLAFDESFSGLDGELKVKAFNLLEHLAEARETILVIDHTAELKQLFHQEFLVTKSAATSSIEAV